MTGGMTLRLLEEAIVAFQAACVGVIVVGVMMRIFCTRVYVSYSPLQGEGRGGYSVGNYDYPWTTRRTRTARDSKTAAGR